jgi:hypothetical protein
MSCSVINDAKFRTRVGILLSRCLIPVFRNPEAAAQIIEKKIHVEEKKEKKEE